MNRENKSWGYWTVENVLEKSKKYTSKTAFREGNGSAYNVAKRKKLLDQMPWLVPLKKPAGYWTKERVFEESKKYTYRAEFARGNSRAYQVAWKNNWLDEMTWLRDCKILDKDQVDCIYVYRFEDQNAIYVGRTIRRKERNYDHHTDENDAVYQFFTQNSLPCPEMEIIEDNLTLLEGSEREGYWKDYYEKEGWNVLNRAKTGGLGGIANGKWHYDSCKIEASKYKSRKEFNKGNESAYRVSRKRGWLDEFFGEKLKEARKVDQLDLEGNYIKTFESAKEAERVLKICNTSIGLVCKGKRNKAGGYKWSYHKEGEN